MIIEAKPSAPASPFTGGVGRIALALSGGGFRAAAFHFGTMRALRAVGLFEDVRVLSTASGGSILGALFVSSVVEGKSFEEFELQLRALLSRNIVAEALDGLHRGARRKSLIQRAAEVYDGLFKARRLGELADDPNLKARVDHVVINATHFSLGYGFRFTFPARQRARFGNKSVSITPSDGWREIRLADAVAASSCFPAGFEPLLFPQDFDWRNQPPTVSASVPYAAEAERSLPLMDGGIHDNQAVDAVLLIDSATSGSEGAGDDLGLLFCSDTDQKQMPFYAPLRQGFWWKLGRLIPVWFAAVVLGVASAAAALLGQIGGGGGAAALVLATLFGAPVALLPLILLKVHRSVPFHYPQLPRVLLRMTFGDLASLIAERVHSVLALTTKVFMYRVRALGYEVARLKMPNRVVESHVYDSDLDSSDARSRLVRERATRARRVETALWMTNEEQHDVIETGHASAIGALRRYLQRWRDAGTDFRADLAYPAALAERVEIEWSRLNAPPTDDSSLNPEAVAA